MELKQKCEGPKHRSWEPATAHTPPVSICQIDGAAKVFLLGHSLLLHPYRAGSI